MSQPQGSGKVPAILTPWWVVLFAQVTVLGLVAIPYPALVLELYDDDSSATAWFVGINNGGAAFLQIFSHAILGALSDWYGRRFFLGVAVLGAFWWNAVIAVHPSLVTLIAASVIRGLTDASFPIVAAAIGDVIDLFHFGQAYGKLLAWSGLGVIAGSILAVIATAVTDWRSLTFFIGAGIQLCAWVYHLFMPRETLGRAQRLGGLGLSGEASGGSEEDPAVLAQRMGVHPAVLGRSGANQGNQGLSQGDSGGDAGRVDGAAVPFSWARVRQKLDVRRTVRILGENRFVTLSAVCLALNNIWFSGLVTVTFLYTEHVFGWSDAANAVFVLVFGVVTIAVQGFLLPYILPEHRIGERRTLAIAYPMCAVVMFLFGLASEGWMLYAVLLLGSPSFVVNAVHRGALSRELPPERSGELQGALSFLTCMATVVGPLLLSGSFGLFVADNAPVYLPGIPFFISSLLTAVSWFINWRAYARHGDSRNVKIEDAVKHARAAGVAADSSSNHVDHHNHNQNAQSHQQTVDGSEVVMADLSAA